MNSTTHTPRRTDTKKFAEEAFDAWRHSMPTSLQCVDLGNANHEAMTIGAEKLGVDVDTFRSAVNRSIVGR